MFRVRLLLLLNRTSRPNTAQLVPIVSHLLLWILIENLFNELFVVLLLDSHVLPSRQLGSITFHVFCRLECEACVPEYLVLSGVSRVHGNSGYGLLLFILTIL